MGLTRIALLRPVAITMLFLALAAMGIVAYTRLPVERFPNISFPFVGISVGYPGASPEDVERLITTPLENAVVGVNGISQINSNSSEGNASVFISFNEGTDVGAASIDIERKVNGVRRRLPAGATDPSINTADPNAFPVMNVAISSTKLDLQTLTTLVQDQISPLIQSVPGVADANLSGGATRQIEIRVDMNKLQSYGLSLTQVQNALASENVSQPGGVIRTASQVFNTRTQALIAQPSGFGSIVISAAANTSAGAAANTLVGSSASGPVYLKDVAQVLDTTAFQTSYQRLNGKTAVGLSITQQAGTNEIQVADGVRAAIAKLQTSMGDQSGIHFDVVNDQSVFTRAAVSDVQRNLYLAILLTAIVLLVFLHTLRNTLMVLIAIPTSIVSTFFVMFALGFNLDTMSLMALALLIGILVDDSIVVLENINRHLALGENPWEAALKGRSEIGLAAIAITLTDVVVYTPVAFMTGNIGQLFREFGLTIVAATLFSLLVSFTLTPMLASRLLSGESLEHITGRGPWAMFTRWWERMFVRLTELYRRVLGQALKVRWLPVLVGFAMLALVISFIPLHVVGQEFTPQEDDNQFNVRIIMPVGTAVSAANAASQQVEGELLHIPEVRTVFASVGGGGGPFGGGEGNASISVGLVDKGQRSRSVFQISRQVAALANNIPGAFVSTSVPAPLFGGGFGAPVSVVITGNDFNQLGAIATQVVGILQNTPGAVQARSSAIVPSPEYDAIVDPAKAADAGVTAQTIANTLNTAIEGVTATEYQPAGQDQVNVVLQVKGAETLTPALMGAIPIQTSKGTIVRLDQLATIVRSTSPGTIAHYNRQRTVSVSASVQGRPVGDVIADVQKRTEQLALPPGYTISIQGVSSQLNTAFGALIQALTLSIVLMYMLMAALYESLIYPFAVLFCLPVALVGAFLGLIVVGDTINIFSMIGMIMLVGLVAKNAILLVDYTNTLRQRGLSRDEALLEAGPTRLRPILMTTTTLVFAMIPLALKLGDGAESRSPMAVVVLGGMITSTLLTLVLVPCAYSYLDDLQRLLLRPLRRARGQGTTPAVIAGGSEDAL